MSRRTAMGVGGGFAVWDRLRRGVIIAREAVDPPGKYSNGGGDVGDSTEGGRV